MKNWKKYLKLFFLFTVLGYPLFYYAYKYGTPEFGGLDVLSYYKLYTNWDFHAVDSPFNQRIISTYLTYLLHKTGIHYSTETNVQAFGLDPQVYFCALLFNFMCVVATCVVIYRLVEKHAKATSLFAFFSGTLFLLGFGTITFLLSGLTDALSVLLVAIIFKYFLEKSWWLLPFLLIAILQREHVFLVFGFLAVLYWIPRKADRKYYLLLLGVNIFFFAIYFVLRKTVFFTPRYDYQASFDQLLNNIVHSIDDAGAYVRQTFLLQNLLLLYLAVIVYKWFSKLPVDRFHLLVSFALLAQVIVIGVLVRLGNNTGRCFYMAIPIIIFYLALEARPLLEEKPGAPK